MENGEEILWLPILSQEDVIAKGRIPVTFYFRCDFLKIDFRGRQEGRQREGIRGREIEKDQFVVSLMHSLVDSSMCPDQGLNPHPWHIGSML